MPLPIIHVVPKEEMSTDERACVNLMNFNKAKCKVLQLGQGNLQYQHRLEDGLIEKSPAEKNLGMQNWI